MKRLLVLLALFAAAGPVLAAETGETLERVVLVQRHGVRSLTKPPAAYARFSSEAWPDWPVKPGELTSHGAENIRLMGAGFKSRYAGLGLLPAEACPAAGAVSVWADGADERTRDSGQAFLDGAFPDCRFVAAHGPEGQHDPVFDGAESACPANGRAAREALEAGLRGLSSRRAEMEQAKAVLYGILTPPSDRHPCKDDQAACFLYGQDKVQESGSWARLDGPLSNAASLSEALLLEYAQGMEPARVGWGRASAADIGRVMLLHNLSSSLARAAPYLASHNGAVLARTVLAGLDGEEKDTLKVITGHDTNLSNLAGILGASWSLPGQPDDTPPGGALAFELWRDAGGHRLVRLSFFYQTLEDMRAARGALAKVDIPLKGCGPEGCPLEAFVERVQQALPAECRRL